ncbi:MAG: GNAT family N-acetyltransferase [Acidimicrobiales bacterium]
MPRLPEIVETPRLTLRVWRLGDAPALSRAVATSAAHLRPWMPWADGSMTAAQYEEFITERRERWAEGGEAVYGVFAGDAVVGGTGLHTRRGPGILEIGYWIHVEHVGRGYATESAGALTDVAFTVDGIERVEIHHDRANDRSRAVPERLGFTFDGETTEEPRAPAEAGFNWTWAVQRSAWLGRSRRTP